MVRIQVQLTAQQISGLMRMAAREHCSTAALVRRGVEGVLARPSANDAAGRRERARRIVGRYRSGHDDLAPAHDRHLAETLGR